MIKRNKILVVGASVIAIAAGTAGAAFAGGENDSAEQVSSPGADSATAAALDITGGTANSVERDSENGATWEVEVTKPDSNTVDVRLDQDYNLVVVEGDSESPDSSE